MPYLKNKHNNKDVNLFYRDLGKGQPVLLIHPWPVNGDAWELQIQALTDAGFRCIVHDRRGFGKSDVVWDAYDYDAHASDVHALIEQLNLSQVILAGYSMGGGEVVRYLTNYGSAKVAKAALIASIIPLVAQKPDNPAGVPQEMLNELIATLKAKRVTFLREFFRNFYNYDEQHETVSRARLDADFIAASQASGHATVQSAEAWAFTDFRSELKNVTVPTLIVHGDADKLVPIQTSGDLAAKGIANHEYVVIKGGSHGINFTHTKELNEALIRFCKKPVA